MAIELLKHNQDAYMAAMQMLQATGKAAVIHPTRTGNPLLHSNCARTIPKR
ncbi:MAG: hypothetical protein IKB80_00885 [Oscillospiraceae bacterium]|nr:hypothetical protein [Oscillospiraceae bacterium]